MRKLRRQIKRELKAAKHCAIYEEELSRVWPDDGHQREKQIVQFAEDHGFRRDFIVAVYAPFSIKSLARAARGNLSARVNHTGFGAKIRS
jgi:hypothetical protein